MKLFWKLSQIQHLPQGHQMSRRTTESRSWIRKILLLFLCFPKNWNALVLFEISWKRVFDYRKNCDRVMKTVRVHRSSYAAVLTLSEIVQDAPKTFIISNWSPFFNMLCILHTENLMIFVSPLCGQQRAFGGIWHWIPEKNIGPRVTSSFSHFFQNTPRCMLSFEQKIAIRITTQLFFGLRTFAIFLRFFLYNGIFYLLRDRVETWNHVMTVHLYKPFILSSQSKERFWIGNATTFCKSVADQIIEKCSV